MTIRGIGPVSEADPGRLVLKADVDSDSGDERGIMAGSRGVMLEGDEEPVTIVLSDADTLHADAANERRFRKRPVHHERYLQPNGCLLGVLSILMRAWLRASPAAGSSMTRTRIERLC